MYADLLRRSRDRAQSILSPARWLGGQSDTAPAPALVPSDSQPTPLPAFLAQAQQGAASQAAASQAAARAVQRTPLPAAARLERQTGQRGSIPAARSSHNTEWRWNLGGPSSGGQSHRQASRQQQQRQQVLSGNAVSSSQNTAATEWRWNLGGAWQQPGQGHRSSQSDVQAQTSRQLQANAQAQGEGQPQADRHHQSSSREIARDSGSGRPWQRRRLQEGADNEQPTAEARHAAARADHSSPQGWRRLVPRFLRRGDSSQAGQTTTGLTGTQSDVFGHQSDDLLGNQATASGDWCIC